MEWFWMIVILIGCVIGKILFDRYAKYEKDSQVLDQLKVDKSTIEKGFLGCRYQFAKTEISEKYFDVREYKNGEDRIVAGYGYNEKGEKLFCEWVFRKVHKFEGGYNQRIEYEEKCVSSICYPIN